MSAMSAATTPDPARPIKKRPRSVKACQHCRAKKTRCLMVHGSSKCFRCNILGLECSLDTKNTENEEQLEPLLVSSSSRLDRLESSMSEVLNILRSQIGQISHPTPPENTSLEINDDQQSYSNIQVRDEDSLPSFGQPSLSFRLSPYNIYGCITSEKNHPLPLRRLYDPQMVVHDQDIISMGLITEDEALELLQYFRENYNRWVSFPEDVEIEVLMDRIRRRCSLLLSVCCCVVIRYYKREFYESRYGLILQKLQNELSLSMIIVPQTIEFMQALALIAIHAASLSYGSIVFDGWFYSSIALKHFITKDVLGLVMSFDGVGPVTEFDEITAYRVWNHICLVHMVCCVFSGRMCILDETRLDLCRRTLRLPSATNFDGRMVAEIANLLVVYNFTELPQSLETVIDELTEWQEEWGYLFEQPAIQFVESGYHFGYFLVLHHWWQLKFLTQKTCEKEIDGLQTNGPDTATALKEDQFFIFVDIETIKEMIGHLLKIIDCLLSIKSNTYFSCLSDQVLFQGAYSSIMMGKILQGLNVCGRGRELNKPFVNMLQTRVTRLASRFRNVTTSQDDITVRYADAIMENLSSS